MTRKMSDAVLVGRAAVFADLVTVVVCALVVSSVYFVRREQDDAAFHLVLGMSVLGVGALGALAAGEGHVGMIRSGAYVARFLVTVAIMIACDLAVRSWLGGDLALVFSNWAILIGSASGVNLLLTRRLAPVRALIEGQSMGTFHPMALVIATLLQVGQAWLSVLGAGLVVVAVQLLVRRIVVLPVTHAIALGMYGRGAANELRRCRTIEYVAHRSVADDTGGLVESDVQEQCAVGDVLLKLPIYGGEPMTAGIQSVFRVLDKLVMLEQMLAFSSPTLVVGRPLALGHVQFLQIFVNRGTRPPEQNPLLNDHEACRRWTAEFFSGHVRGGGPISVEASSPAALAPDDRVLRTG